MENRDDTDGKRDVLCSRLLSDVAKEDLCCIDFANVMGTDDHACTSWMEDDSAITANAYGRNFIILLCCVLR